MTVSGSYDQDYPKEISSVVYPLYIPDNTYLTSQDKVKKTDGVQLSLFDYVMGISIGNFSAEMILVLDGQIINGVVAILTFGIAGFLISYLSTKSIFIRRLFFASRVCLRHISL